MNPFKYQDIVKTVEDKEDRKGGVVMGTACVAATKAGGNLCKPDQCSHSNQDFVWVKWPSGKICSYNFKELEKDTVSKTTTIEDVKKMVKEHMTPKKDASVDWNRYNGYTKVKVDRQGRPYLQESVGMESTTPPLKESEVDWAAYAGFKRGPYKKSVDKSG